MTFALSGFMLYTMWVVLAVIAVDMLAGLYRSLRSNTFTFSDLTDFLSGILYYVFPLFILVNLMSLDPTGLLVQIAFYVGAVGTIFKYLLDIQSKL